MTYPGQVKITVIRETRSVFCQQATAATKQERLEYRDQPEDTDAGTRSAPSGPETPEVSARSRRVATMTAVAAKPAQLRLACRYPRRQAMSDIVEVQFKNTQGYIPAIPPSCRWVLATRLVQRPSPAI